MVEVVVSPEELTQWWVELLDADRPHPSLEAEAWQSKDPQQEEEEVVEMAFPYDEEGQ